MSESWSQWAAGVIAVLFGWIGKRLHDRQDRIEQNYVTRDELRRVVESISQDRREMHDENRETLERIHERVDQLWDRKMGR